MKTPDAKFTSLVFFVNSSVPLGFLVYDALTGGLGTNPLEFVTRTTGTLTLVFLLLSLAITPVRKLFGLNWLIKQRRQVGLWAFFYLSLHLLTYLIFDRNLQLGSVPADVVKRPFIAVGMAAFLMMLPLAITSTNNMIKRLGGKRWAKLHKLVYPCAVLGCLHFWMLVKADTTRPLLYALILAALLGYRMYAAQQTPPLSLKTGITSSK